MREAPGVLAAIFAAPFMPKSSGALHAAGRVIDPKRSDAPSLVPRRATGLSVCILPVASRLVRAAISRQQALTLHLGDPEVALGP